MSGLQKAWLGMAAAGVLGFVGYNLDAQERAVEIRGARQSDAAAEAGFYRATDVIGMVIKDEEGQAVGQVSDIVIDGSTEQVQYLIVEDVEQVAEGNFLILPWSVAEVHYADVPDQRFVVVRLPRTRLLQAPTFARNRFNLRRGADWSVQVNTFFDVDTRNSRRRSARPDLDNDRGRQRDSRRARDSQQAPESRSRGSQPDADSTRPNQESATQPQQKEGKAPQRPKAEQPKPQEPAAEPADPNPTEEKPESPKPTPKPNEKP